MKWRKYDPDVLPMWVAEMDTLLPAPVAEALAAAVSRGDTGYAEPGRFAEAYSEFSLRRFGWAPEPARCRLVPDVLRGIVEVLQVVTAPGDGVVITTPVYHPFFTAITCAGRRVVEVPLLADGFRLDLSGLAAAFAEPGVTAFLLCNPHNPTGSVFGPEQLREVAALAERHGVRMLVDEIHAMLTYPGIRAVPFLSLAGEAGAAARAFSFTSASKAFNLPGLKAALVVAGPDADPDLARIPVDVSFGAGLFGVIGGEAALRYGEDWLDALIAGLDENRALLGRLLAEHLPDVGYQPPEATYLAWLDCRALGLGDGAADRFLLRGRVAVSPGGIYGTPGRGFVRLNFATSADLLAEGVRRMAAALAD
jgi:cystathionine beta-lyase